MLCAISKYSSSVGGCYFRLSFHLADVLFGRVWFIKNYESLKADNGLRFYLLLPIIYGISVIFYM
jgi:hypothetical protein